MSRSRQFLLPCGRVIFFKETTPKDIGAKKSVMNLLVAHRGELDKLVSWKGHGRNKNRWAPEVFNKFSTILSDMLTERLLNGDRITTLDNHMWMIAGVEQERKKERYLNWHTDGKTYSVIIRGLNGRFGIRMSRARRRQLKDHINSGQKYHV